MDDAQRQKFANALRIGTSISSGQQPSFESLMGLANQRRAMNQPQGMMQEPTPSTLPGQAPQGTPIAGSPMGAQQQAPMADQSFRNDPRFFSLDRQAGMIGNGQYKLP